MESASTCEVVYLARECRVIQLGLCDYMDAYKIQKQILDQRKSGTIPDTLLFLSHPPVLTIGRRGNRKNILVSDEVLYREGIVVYETDRGGDITYHGPGQIVGYPVLDLKQFGRDVHRIINMYEEVIIRLLKYYDLEGSRVQDYPGVWIGNEKICALGIGISRWVSFHGFALNVNTNLNHFSYIIPCGITGRGVTSMSKVLERNVDESEVTGFLTKIFGMVFGLQMYDH